MSIKQFAIFIICLSFLSTGAAKAQDSISEVLKRLTRGEHNPSISELKQIVPDLKRDGDTYNLAMANYLISYHYGELNDCYNAKAYADSTQLYFDIIGYDLYRYPRLYLGLGRCFIRNQRFEDALNQLRKGLDVPTSDYDSHDIKSICAVEASMLLRSSLREPVKAKRIIEYFSVVASIDSLPLVQRVSHIIEHVICLSELRETSKAFELLTYMEQEVLNHPNKSQNYYLSKIDNERGFLFDILRDFEKSRESYISIIERGINSPILKLKALSNASAASNYLDDFENGIEYAIKAKELYERNKFLDPENYHLISDNLSSAYLGMNNYEMSLLEVNEGIRKCNNHKESLLVEKSNLIFTKSRIFYHHYLKFNRNNSLDSAGIYIDFLDSLVNQIIQNQTLEQSQINWKETTSKYYTLMADIAYEKGDNDLMWYASEKSKNLLLLQNASKKKYNDQNQADSLKFLISQYNGDILSGEYASNRTTDDLERDSLDRLLANLRYEQMQSIEALNKLEINNPTEVIPLNEVNPFRRSSHSTV